MKHVTPFDSWICPPRLHSGTSFVAQGSWRTRLMRYYQASADSPSQVYCRHMFENVPSPSVSPNPAPPTPPPQPWAQPGGVPPAPQPISPVAPPPSPVEGEKDWGPLKPIRRVPKPGEERIQSTLAVAAMPQVADVETKSKVGMILGLIGLLVVIGGGTAAFVFFGKKTDDTKLNGNVNTVAAVTNVNTNRSVFPEGNSNTNQSGNQNVNAAGNANSTGNVNAAGNVNQNSAVSSLDTDQDGLLDKDELYLGTNPQKADSDGDGFADAAELSKGYSPLGSGELTVAHFRTYCTALTAGNQELTSWIATEKQAFCTKAEESIGRLLPKQKTLTLAKFVEAVGAEFTTMQAYCTQLFPSETSAGEAKGTTCALEAARDWAVFFQAPAS